MKAADNFPFHHLAYPGAHPETHERYIEFHLTESDRQKRLPVVGLIREQGVLAALEEEVQTSENPAWVITSSEFSATTGPTSVESVAFADWVIEAGQAGEVINDLAKKWKREGKFPGPLGGKSSRMSACTGDGV